MKIYLEKNVSSCSKCGTPYTKKSNNQKLCPSCYIDYRNNYQKELMREKKKDSIKMENKSQEIINFC